MKAFFKPVSMREASAASFAVELARPASPPSAEPITKKRGRPKNQLEQEPVGEQRDLGEQDVEVALDAAAEASLPAFGPSIEKKRNARISLRSGPS